MFYEIDRFQFSETLLSIDFNSINFLAIAKVKVDVSSTFDSKHLSFWFLFALVENFVFRLWFLFPL